MLLLLLLLLRHSSVRRQSLSPIIEHAARLLLYLSPLAWSAYDSSQPQSKPQRQSTHQHRPARTRHPSSSAITLPIPPVAPSTAATALSRKPGVHHIVAATGLTRRRARGARIHSHRALRTTGVLTPTIARAAGVAAAVADALVAPFLADEEGQGLAVLGEVRGQAVGADAGVGQGAGGAVVVFGDARCGLQADAGAGVSTVFVCGFGRVSLVCVGTYSGHCVCC